MQDISSQQCASRSVKGTPSVQSDTRGCPLITLVWKRWVNQANKGIALVAFGRIGCWRERADCQPQTQQFCSGGRQYTVHRGQDYWIPLLTTTSINKSVRQSISKKPVIEGNNALDPDLLILLIVIVSVLSGCAGRQRDVRAPRTAYESDALYQRQYSASHSFRLIPPCPC